MEATQNVSMAEHSFRDATFYLGYLALDSGSGFCTSVGELGMKLTKLFQRHPWSDGRQEVAVLPWSSPWVRGGGKNVPIFCHHSSGTNHLRAKAPTREAKGG